MNSWMQAVAAEFINIASAYPGRKQAETTMRRRLVEAIQKHCPPSTSDNDIEVLERLYHWCPPLEGHPEREKYEKDLDAATEVILRRANGGVTMNCPTCQSPNRPDKYFVLKESTPIKESVFTTENSEECADQWHEGSEEPPIFGTESRGQPEPPK